jgi:Carbohydrate binding module (family 6)
MKTPVSFRPYERAKQIRVKPGGTLFLVLSTKLGMTGPKYGCGISQCGAYIALAAVLLFSPASARSETPTPKDSKSPTQVAKPYLGVPYHDSVYKGGPQSIPGRLQNEYYDTMDISVEQKAAGAEEGITYHDTDNKNDGSGALNGKGTYNKEFRISESPDISYVKCNNPGTPVDDTPFNLVQPEPNSLYLGWIAPGEWVKYTVEVKEEGVYALTIMYTSKFGGKISIDSNGVDVSGPLDIPSTFNAADPIEWRQAHHWNKISKVGKLHLKKGLQVLTLHFLDQPVMNFDYMDFVKLD